MDRSAYKRVELAADDNRNIADAICWLFYMNAAATDDGSMVGMHFPLLQRAESIIQILRSKLFYPSRSLTNACLVQGLMCVIYSFYIEYHPPVYCGLCIMYIVLAYPLIQLILFLNVCSVANIDVSRV